MPNADVKIRVGIQSKKRYEDEPFMPSKSWTENFPIVTDLNTYESDTLTLALEAFTYIEQQRAIGAVNTVFVSVTLQNVTHPDTAAGVIPLAKQHRDASLSGDEFTSADVLVALLNKIIVDLRQQAKY